MLFQDTIDIDVFPRVCMELLAVSPLLIDIALLTKSDSRRIFP